MRAWSSGLRPSRDDVMKGASMFYEALVAAASSADDLPVNANRFKHADIVEALHHLLHAERPLALRRNSVRICHADGSESAGFPLVRCSQAPEWDVASRSLRVGFVSGRHPELDRVVDLYLLRNSEIRQFDTSADLEQEVFERAMRLFQEAADSGHTQLEALHTGLETVTIGFYRAVIEQAQALERSSGGHMLLRPRIWSPPHVNIGALVADAKGQIDRTSLEQALDRLVTETSTFLRVERMPSDRGVAVKLHWLPERPMFASERDWLSRRTRVATPAVECLYRRAQYGEGKVWVLQ